MSIAKDQPIGADDLINNIYPIGSIFLTLSSADYSTYLGKTWEKLPEGKALWTASSGVSCTSNTTTDNTNNSIAAGLPNITGTFNSGDAIFWNNNCSGAFTALSSVGPSLSNAPTGNKYCNGMSFSANNGASTKGIYGNSTTVQPPAYKVYAWRRTK